MRLRLQDADDDGGPLPQLVIQIGAETERYLLSGIMQVEKERALWSAVRQGLVAELKSKGRKVPT